MINKPLLSLLSLTLEAKLSQQDDPFKDVPTVEGFLHDSDKYHDK